MRVAPTTIGSLRHRLSLQEVQRASDAGGGAEENWTTVAIVWGDVRPTGGNEGASENRVQGRVSHEVLIRSRPGVVPAMRFAEGVHIYEIMAVIEVEGKRKLLKCLCEERKL
jgi:SPP1 family predicted phage head-tail adaptor